MKLFLLLTLLIGLGMALEFSELDSRQHRHRTHKKTSRPKKFTGASSMRAASRPKGAPAEYKTGTDKATRKRSKANLKKMPADLIDPDQKRRRDSLHALRLLRRQATAADFYECGTGPAPADADCQVVIDQVLNSDETLVVNANSCLTFVYQSCQGFFCALCETLATTTDFVGNQLDSAEALCVADGSTGTVVGQDPPQWDAGLLNVGDGLPTYDVC
ncbi:hypothetical protein CONLIGDRAFT_717405 [Coniochaeta ligniaria NRRL 30616]|uniref:Uncharacterized protein n=1 Tax=Coniochaeta ligniaria NRRL 30616 TaxID=1408157 RepID=A0A1J7IE52_9PEZI|nr:hypothetical protein CONLIGDRAFT_717405 [Coniochaeta ligniaria NRRL 30616]